VLLISEKATDRGAIGMLAAILDNWWAFCALLVASMLIFGILLPKAKAPVFAEASPELPRKVLDEYFWTWTPEIARQFFLFIGPNGRRAYRRFYWSIDFWFPSLVASLANLSLLLLAFPRSSDLTWLIFLAFAGWLFESFQDGGHLPGLVPSFAACWPAIHAHEMGFRTDSVDRCTAWLRATA